MIFHILLDAHKGDGMRSKSKYFAKRTEYNGISFPSKREADYCAKLDALRNAGKLLYYLRQVPIDLPGGVKYRVDFVEFWPGGKVRYVDVKGMRTPVYKLKKKQVEALFPIKIEEE